MFTQNTCLSCLRRLRNDPFSKHVPHQTAESARGFARLRPLQARQRPGAVRKVKSRAQAQNQTVFRLQLPTPSRQLSAEDIEKIRVLSTLSTELARVTEGLKGQTETPFHTVLERMKRNSSNNGDTTLRQEMIDALKASYGSLSTHDGRFTVSQILKGWNWSSQDLPTKARTWAGLKNLGIFPALVTGPVDIKSVVVDQSESSLGDSDERVSVTEKTSSPNGDQDFVTAAEGAGRHESLSNAELQRFIALEMSQAKELTGDQLALEPILVGQPNVPRLTHDLSRVLFNPGVYQLQDPRSRVYNFDPYLQKIMPVSEFNYDALNEYITSSRDEFLSDLARQHDKRYLGSSSSMSGPLCQFHYLLSTWRELTFHNITRGFREEASGFTRIQKGPAAIFLRRKNGVYAVDADKEFDSANILMSLGKSMEKLVTVGKDEYEKYRKSESATFSETEDTGEQYHYGGCGQFLLRSQLDAYDPRLPGTGMFDLKTRAVVSIRMMTQNHEKGVGYEIQDRFGTWESYEREYYDMIRSAFLKYSLQARMGRMDGIFVTFHNVERIFGFQYIPLPELDLALHGQTDPSLGDQEFAMSIRLIEAALDEATAQFPDKSLRLHFETRPRSETRLKSGAQSKLPPFMYIFAEPMEEKEIERIQELRKEEIAAFEEKLFNPVSEETHPASEKSAKDERDESLGQIGIPSTAADSSLLDSLDAIDIESAMQETAKTPSDEQLDAAFEPTIAEPGPLLGFKLTLQNVVNGQPVIRPEKVTDADKWNVRYNLQKLPDAEAHRRYLECKKRRKDTLSKTDQATGQYYLNNLVRKAEAGAKWRKERDALDADKTPVMLYE